MNIPRAVMYYGRRSDATPVRRRLRAGALDMLLEGVDLRYIKLGNVEILRRIYVAVRDPDWKIIMPTVSNFSFDLRPESFKATFSAEHERGDINFSWKGRITGSARSGVQYHMIGESKKDFLTNRVGFCVLHPIKGYAGKQVEALKVDGSTERRELPLFISPDQPLSDLRGIDHEIVPGVWAQVQFDGDIFEMEDQRNWTDASYKTYSRPQRLPRPFLVRKGEKVVQSITLSLRSPRPVKRVQPPREVELALDEQVGTVLPRIGLCVASHESRLTDQEARVLGKLNLAHLRVDLNVTEAGWKSRLARASLEAKAMGTTLEVALFLPEFAEKELEGLCVEVARTKPPVSAWLIFDQKGASTPENSARTARRLLSGINSKALIGGGTNNSFRKINVLHPPVNLLDFVSYSIDPQEHCTDDLTLIENLEGQAWTVASAREFCDGVAIAPGPITLRPRPQPGAGDELSKIDHLPVQVDRRQMSLLGACWTLGSIKYISEAGASSATYYETTGWKGVMEAQKGPPDPDEFISEPGMLYPIYHVLADVGEMRDGRVVKTISSDPLRVDALTIRKKEKAVMLVANMTCEKQMVTVPNLGDGNVRVRRLNERTCRVAMFDEEVFRTQGEVHTARRRLRLPLLPYEMARLDFSA